MAVWQYLGGKSLMGGACDKARVRAIIAGRDSLTIRGGLDLVIKDVWVSPYGSDLFGNERQEMTHAQRYFSRWEYLVKCGIPTVDSMWIVGEEQVAMENMVNGGGDFFGKAKADLTGSECFFGDGRPLSDLECAFLSLDMDDVKGEIARVQEMGIKCGIRLPYDDPFDLIVFEDGSFRVVVADLTFMYKLTRLKPGELEEERAGMFDLLGKIRENLLKIAVKYYGSKKQ